MKLEKESPTKNETFRLAGIRTLTSAIPVRCSNQYVLGTLRSDDGGRKFEMRV